MARRSAGRKSYRVLDLLSGLEAPEVRSALASHGFSKKELDLGWSLLRRVGRARRPLSPPERSREVVLGPIDAWENRWFVVAAAALSKNHPKAQAWLFRNLTRQRGVEVIVSVMVFTERLRKLESGVKELGDEAKRARELLVRRGLTEEVLAEGERLLKAAQQLPSDAPLPPPPTQNVDEAEAEMWNWYLEWSQIARAVITEPRLMNHLGLGKRGRPPKAK